MAENPYQRASAVEETEWIWFNGKFVPWKECKIHFLTHSLHYGGAVFEGIRCYGTPKGPAVFRLKDHIKRLFFSADTIGIRIPFTEGQIIEASKEVVKKNNLKECYIRPLVFYGYGKMGLDTAGATVDVGIAAWPWGAYLGKEGVEKGVSVKISPFIRPPREMMPTHAKVSGNYANSILAKMDALNTGYKEAVLLDNKGNISECSGENIFIAKKGSLFTPPTENTLDGITRKSVMKIAENTGVKVMEKKISKKEFFSADEAFMTGTAAEITPITFADKKPIGKGVVGKITKKMQSKYSEVIHGNDLNYFEWLDFV